MGIEGPPREADVSWPIFAIAFHKSPSSADDTDWQATADRLAVSHKIGAHVEVFLRSTACDTKTEKHLIENQRNPAFRANLTQFSHPLRVSRLIEMRAPSTIDQTRVRWRSHIWMQRLHRIHQPRNTGSCSKNVQCRLRQLSQRVGLVCWNRVANTRLHVSPPAVIRAAKAHQMRAPRVETRQPNGLHDRFRSGHVERYFVESR